MRTGRSKRFAVKKGLPYKATVIEGVMEWKEQNRSDGVMGAEFPFYKKIS